MIDERRLQNWGRWLRSGYAPATAMSAEGDYRAPADPYALTDARPSDPDARDAWDIEVACRILPVQHHVLLKLLHVYRLQVPAVLKAMRRHFGRVMSRKDLDAAEGMALSLLSDALDVPAVVRMSRAQDRARRVLAEVVAAARTGPLDTQYRHGVSSAQQ